MRDRHFPLWLLLIGLLLFVTACGTSAAPTPLPTPAIANAEAATRAAEEVNTNIVAGADVDASAAIRSTTDAAAFPAPTPDPTIQQVEIAMSDGTVLRGTYYKVANDEGPVPGILLMHSAHQDRAHWHEFAQQLQQAGFVVLAYDARGHGESDGEHNFDQIMVDDGDWALGWLLSVPEIDRDRVGIAGSSVGGIVALRVALLYPEVGAVAMLSSGRKMWALSADDVLEEYGTRPIWFAAAFADEYHAESTEWLAAKALGDATLHMYEGDAHGTDMLTSHSELPALLLEFFQTTLRTP